MNSKTLSKLFTLNHRVLTTNIQGISAAESFRAPRPAGNSLNWVVGHLTSSRHGLLAMLGEPEFWPGDGPKRYARGSDPIEGEEGAESWDRLVSLFDGSQALLIARVGRMDEAALAAPPPPGGTQFGSENVAELLATFSFHESYHVGQTGVLRRLLGKPGAIK